MAPNMPVRMSLMEVPTRTACPAASPVMLISPLKACTMMS
jgi:hypothetical protein